MKQAKNKPGRVLLSDLASDIGEALVTPSLDGLDGLQRALTSACYQVGGDFADAANPGILPHIRRAIEAGQVTVRSALNNIPALNADNVIPHNGVWRPVNDGSGLPEYDVSALSLWYVTPEDADVVREIFGLPEYYSKQVQLDELGETVRSHTTAPAGAAVRQKLSLAESAVGLGDAGDTFIAGEGKAQRWRLVSPERYRGYRKPLYDFLKAALDEGRSCPKARDVLDCWAKNKPLDVDEVLADEIKYRDAKGNIKTADLKAIQQAIKNLAP